MINLSSMDLKKEIKELKSNDPGKERGEDIKYLVHYVEQKVGSDGPRKVMAELKKAGYNMPDISSIDNMDWIPTSLVTIFFVTSVKLFNWQEKDIIEIGKSAVSLHSLIKLFVRYFMSLRKTFVAAARKWRKYYSFSELEIVKYNIKDKTLVVRLLDFKIHPLTCIYYKGVFGRIVEIATGSKNVRIKESKCIFTGDSYHEFEIAW